MVMMDDYEYLLGLLPAPKLDYSNMSINELRKELKDRKLGTEGLRKDLVSRLEENDLVKGEELLEGDGELEEDYDPGWVYFTVFSLCT